jgi:hypothetical protein
MYTLSYEYELENQVNYQIIIEPPIELLDCL